MSWVARAQGGSLEWRATTTFSISSSPQAGVSHVDVQVPSECEVLDAGTAPPAPAGDSHYDKETRIAHVPLEPGPLGSFVGSLKVRYRLAPPGATRGPASLTLPLPRPLQASDGGARIDISVPDDVELLPTAESEVKEAHRLNWRTSQRPEQVAFAIQPFRQEIHVASVVDVTLHGATAQVKQELRIRFPHIAAKQLTLPRRPPSPPRCKSWTAGNWLLWRRNHPKRGPSSCKRSARIKQLTCNTHSPRPTPLSPVLRIAGAGVRGRLFRSSRLRKPQAAKQKCEYGATLARCPRRPAAPGWNRTLKRSKG